MFEDQIIIFWVDPHGRPPTEWSDEFSDFADLVMDSRYYNIRTNGNYNSIILIDECSDIMRYVTDWSTRTHTMRTTPTVYFGFQGGYGWTHPQFHDILNKVAAIPAFFPGIKVQWLPDNWFDHPGLTPPNMNTEQTLAWLEQQISTAEPEEIIYDFKGVHIE